MKHQRKVQIIWGNNAKKAFPIRGKAESKQTFLFIMIISLAYARGVVTWKN